MVDAGRLYRRPYPSFERPGPPGHSGPNGGRPGESAQAGYGATLDGTSLDAVASRLDPASQAILGLYRACRLEGERYPECFARLGAPSSRRDAARSAARRPVGLAVRRPRARVDGQSPPYARLLYRPCTLSRDQGTWEPMIPEGR